MAFPNIDVTKPKGTYRVSSIDDYERETRSWLRDCMMEISDYPNSSALKISVWTTSTRPENPNAGTFGYNETTEEFEYWDGTQWKSMSMKLPDVVPKARADRNGNVIDETYATKTALNTL